VHPPSSLFYVTDRQDPLFFPYISLLRSPPPSSFPGLSCFGSTGDLIQEGKVFFLASTTHNIFWPCRVFPRRFSQPSFSTGGIPFDSHLHVQIPFWLRPHLQDKALHLSHRLSLIGPFSCSRRGPPTSNMFSLQSLPVNPSLGEALSAL